MILTNRRHRILFISLAGMEIGWFLPFVITLVVYWQGRTAQAVQLAPLLQRPLVVFVALWATMLLYMLTADLLNRFDLGSAARGGIIFALVLGSGFLTVFVLHRFVMDRDGWAWLGTTLGAIYNFTEGLRPEMVLILINTYLWFRVSVATDRELSFHNVGMSFRIGLLLAILGNALLTTIAQMPDEMAIAYFSLFLSFGLCSVALARIDQKAVGSANSTGALLPWAKFLQLLATVCATVGLTLGLTLLFNPDGLRRFFGFFSPVWTVIRWVLIQIIFLVFLLLSPLLERLALLIRRALGDVPQQQVVEFGPPAEYVSISEIVREWTALRYCMVTAIIFLVLGLIWLFFLRTRFRPRGADEEITSADDVGFGGIAQLGLDRLREWLNLLRRFGFSHSLLAAASVQNMYANLGRIARKRGYPRKPSQAPDDYLQALQKAFPGHELALAEVTDAYMRVHYGDQPIGESELAQIRDEYERIIEPPPLAAASHE